VSRLRAVLLCPGRGSYGREQLGALRRLGSEPALAAALERADAERAREGLAPLRELDASPQFRPGLHLAGRNAAALIYFATLAGGARAFAEYEVAGVLGNSLGWYTALAVAGALSADDGARLVQRMARLQEDVAGGQILTTLVDDEWRPDPALRAATDAAVAAVRALGAEYQVETSIRLGGHEVFGGTEAAVRALLAQLPRVRHGGREFPFQLAGHGPFHTPLCAGVAARAAVELGPDGAPPLDWRRPRCALIDGRGDLHEPASADPRRLADYTAGHQVTCTFDFSAAARTALRELNPDLLVDLGPGATLRAPAGHVILQEGWRGIRTRAALRDADLVRALDAAS
jgi:acyl transferase domain-containing protein